MNKKKEELKMKLEIIVEKIIIRGEQQVRIIKVAGLDRLELPVKYCKSEGSVFVHKGNLMYGMSSTLLDQGGCKNLTKFQEVTDICKKAAASLKKINKELGEKNRGWEGKTTFEF